jgi:hypothetical protein
LALRLTIGFVQNRRRSPGKAVSIATRPPARGGRDGGRPPVTRRLYAALVSTAKRSRTCASATGQLSIGE